MGNIRLSFIRRIGGWMVSMSIVYIALTSMRISLHSLLRISLQAEHNTQSLGNTQSGCTTCCFSTHHFSKLNVASTDTKASSHSRTQGKIAYPYICQPAMLCHRALTLSSAKALASGVVSAYARSERTCLILAMVCFTCTITHMWTSSHAR